MKDSLNLTHLKIRNMDKAISHATSESLIHYSMVFPFLMLISICYYKCNHVSYCCLHFILIQYIQTHICIHHPYFSLFFFFDYKCQLHLSNHFPPCTFKQLIDIIFFLNLTPCVNLPICDRQENNMIS